MLSESNGLNANGKAPSTEGRDPAYFSYYAMLQHQVVFKHLVPKRVSKKNSWWLC